jgi:alkylhydroperoxidase family enzyme
MAATMRGADPLVLFTTLASNERAWSKFTGGSLLDRGPLSLRHRELVIDRTTAQCGCEYEWGVHITGFAQKAGIDAAQIYAIVHGKMDDPIWSVQESVLIATVDALLEHKRLSDSEWADLRNHFDEAQSIEIIQLVSFYHGVSLICGALDLPLEPSAARFPSLTQENSYA